MQRIITSLLAVAPLGLAVASTPAVNAAKNIVFIAVDDLKPILGCYGDTKVKTPNIDRLAARGTVFLTNYCQQAVSGPTRASLMTGMRPDYTKVWDLKTRMREVNPGILTLPEYLKNNGYLTAGLGKIFDSRCVDESLDQPSWSIPYFKNANSYYSSSTGAPMFGYQHPETKSRMISYQEELLAKGIAPDKIRDSVLLRIKPSVENADVPDNAYNDGANALLAKQLLIDFRKNNQPFFLAVGFTKPHLPFVAPRKYWDLYDRDQLPLAAFRDRAENSPAIAYHTSSELRAYSDIPALITFSDQKGGIEMNIDKQKELIHGYYAAISYMDAQVGILLNTIDSLEMNQNTIVVLWGDHGWHLGDHNLWCKHSNFEQATRAPLIISSPGMEANRTTSPTEFIDIFPTLCELNGLEIPSHLQGNSLVEIIKNPKHKVKNYAVSQFPRSVNSQEINRLGYAEGSYMGYSLRTERYRYTVWMKDSYRSTRPFDPRLVVASELYDYHNDPDERVNVVDHPNYNKKRIELQYLMADFFAMQQ